MCSFKADFDPEITPKIGVECFPCECEIILYESFEINNMSVITVETGRFGIMHFLMLHTVSSF